MIDGKAVVKKLNAIKYPLLILAFGIFLMMLPTGAKKETTEESTGSALEQVLRCSEGVGDIRVIVSDNGVVAVCDGASDPGVRLDILRAIGSYTGFGSDKITVLKMMK